MDKLPTALCPLGYPIFQVKSILGSEEKLAEFLEWMKAQPNMVPGECLGVAYSMIYERYYPTACEKKPHGTLYYTIDIKRFLDKDDNDRTKV